MQGAFRYIDLNFSQHMKKNVNFFGLFCLFFLGGLFVNYVNS